MCGRLVGEARTESALRRVPENSAKCRLLSYDDYAIFAYFEIAVRTDREMCNSCGVRDRSRPISILRYLIIASFISFAIFPTLFFV